MPTPAGSKVMVYSAADRRYATGLLEAFARAHPGIEMEYHFGISTALHQRYLEARAEKPEVDMLWSSAMDLQMKLALAGHGARHRSAHRDALPSWAVYNDTAYATTLEPVVTLVNRQGEIPADAPAGSSTELGRLLNREAGRLRGRVACLDIEKNGLGFLALLHHSLDEVAFDTFMEALCACTPRICGSQPALVEALASGEAWLALHALGSYASRAAASNASVSIARSQVPWLAISRIAFICSQAPHPDAAGAFLDFLLSLEGQHALQQAGLYALPVTGEELELTPIPIDRGMPELLDERRRQRVLRIWRKAVGRAQ